MPSARHRAAAHAADAGEGSTDAAAGRSSRAAHKAATRRAIVDAAAALMTRSGSVRTSVDALAAEAGVSRRTVFNHFASLDDVVAAVGAQAFGQVVVALEAVPVPVPVGDRPGGAADPVDAALADLADAVRRADLVTPMAALTRGLGLTSVLGESAAGVPPHEAMLLLRALVAVGEGLTDALARRHPAVPRLDLELAVGAVTSGLVVVHRHWLARTGGATDPAGRAAWSDLVGHLTRPTPTIEGHHG